MGGALGDSLGVVHTMYLGGLVAALAGAWIVLGPVVRLVKWPEAVSG